LPINGDLDAGSVVVTEDVRAFAASSRTGADLGRVAVLRRPAWRWMLVDAIRDAAPAANSALRR